MDVFMEKGLCLERTKMGSGDKETAYTVSRNQGACIAGTIFLAFLLCAAAIIEFKAEMLTAAVNERRMERIKEMAAREEHRPEAKLMRVSTRLEAHLMRDQQHTAGLKVYKARQGTLVEQFKRELLDITKQHDEAGARDSAVIKATEAFHAKVRAVTDTHTRELFKEGERADAALRELQTSIMGELNAGAAEIKHDARLEAAGFGGTGISAGHAEDYPEMEPYDTAGDGAEGAEEREVDRAQRVEAEQAVSKMLERFQERLGAVRRLDASLQAKLPEWQALQNALNDGSMDYDEAGRKMQHELHRAGVKTDDTTPTTEFFSSIVDDLRIIAARSKVMTPLRRWTDGELTVHETLLEVQKLVNAGEVDPNWLISADEEGM